MSHSYRDIDELRAFIRAKSRNYTRLDHSRYSVVSYQFRTSKSRSRFRTQNKNITIFRSKRMRNKRKNKLKKEKTMDLLRILNDRKVFFRTEDDVE